MAKRLSEKEKEEIFKSFSLGMTIEELALEFKFTKLTISRNLKINFGEKRYRELVKRNKSSIKKVKKSKKDFPFENQINSNSTKVNENSEVESFPLTPFIEITPLNYEIDNEPQKDFSSIHIDEIEFPKIVYMIVDKKIELETKYLKDYPDWQFLSEDELKRKTIEIYKDLQNAKRICNKEQKVIKVPNTNVFKIVAPLLLSRGISRIVNADRLIAL